MRGSLFQYFDAELAEMEWKPVKGLSTTTTGKAGLVKKGWGHSPLEREWTDLVGEVTHA
jgi:hypothetical protein